MKSRFAAPSAGLLAICLVLLPSARGQSAPMPATPAASDAAADKNPITPATTEPTVLSPFVIGADQDTGYRATATLQGGRGRIDLADLATQVSVFTKEFMEDLAVNNMEQAYLFSTNTATYYDTVASSSDNRTGAQAPSDINNSRGLGALNKTRNFFRTTIEPDSYNTERLNLVSGSNAVQFGLGGSAGTSDSTGAQANLNRNRQLVKLTTDTYGSQRAVLDISQVIFRNKLALRAVGLRDNKEYFLQPGSEANHRAFVAATYRPFKHTLVKFEGEAVHRSDSRAGTVQTRESGYLSWLATQRAGTPLTYSNLANNAGTVGRPPAPSYTLPTGIVGNYSFDNNSLLWVWPQNSVPSFSYFQDVRNTVVAAAPNLGGGASQSLIVEGYPWNVNPAGFSRYNKRHTERLMATIEQRLTSTTFVELGAATEKYRHTASHLMGDRPYDTLVDINRFMPDGRTPNPMYGRAFVENLNADQLGGTGNMSGQKTKQYRVTVAQEIDFTRKAGWLRHLGKHNLGFLANYEDVATYSLGTMKFLIIGQPSFLSAAAKADPLASERQFNMRFYLPPIGSTSDPHHYGIPSLTPYGDVHETLTFTTATGEKFQVTQKQNPVGFVGSVPSATHIQRGSLAGSTSSRFLRDRIVVNVGARYDRVRNSDFGSNAFVPILTTTTNTNRAYNDFTREIPPDNWRPYRSVTRINSGVIVRPPWVGDWLSFGIDHSKNASLEELAVVTDVNGVTVEPNYGESYEYSARLRLLEGKLHLKFNFFDALNRNINLNDGLRAALLTFERQLALNDSAYPINPLFTQQAGLVAGNFRMTGERRSRGLDFEATYNPARNTRIFWNLGRTDTEIDDQASKPWYDYLAAKLPVWQAHGGGWATAPFNRASPTAQTVQAAYVSTIEGALDNLQASLGNPGGNSQTWRSSLVATQSITEGRLKGATVGVNFRYRGPNILGFANLVDAKGVTRLDKSKPYKTEAFILTGVMASYRFRSYGNTTSKLQLNGNNIFNTKRMVLSRVYSDGTPRNYGRQPGREFILSYEIEH
ncbi:MAG: hypothetical protein JNK23_20300 [Opitutaceae bacterium]|nr:hypothetical protein [Opitutaceae bacterium]